MNEYQILISIDCTSSFARIKQCQHIHLCSTYNTHLSTMQDECREWDISEVVFSPTMWPTYEPLLRADFTLFDEYEHPKNGAFVLMLHLYSVVL